MLRSTLSKKGVITMLISCFVAGVGLFFNGSLRSFLFTLGVTGAVGCGTNGLAIQMLFDRMYLIPRYKKFPIPFSGTLEIQRKQIAQAIGWVVAKRLVSPQAIIRLVTSPDFQSSTCQIIRDKLLALAEDSHLVQKLTQEMEQSLSTFIDSEVFQKNLEDRVFRRLGKAGLMVIAYEVVRGKRMISPYIQQEIKAVLYNTSQDPQFQKHIGNILESLLEHLNLVEPSIKENFQTQGRQILEELVKKVDFETLVAEEVSNFAPGELSSIVLKITDKNLDWLEVWGGVLGGIGGMLFWTIERCLR